MQNRHAFSIMVLKERPSFVSDSTYESVYPLPVRIQNFRGKDLSYLSRELRLRLHYQ